MAKTRQDAVSPPVSTQPRWRQGAERGEGFFCFSYRLPAEVSRASLSRHQEGENKGRMLRPSSAKISSSQIEERFILNMRTIRNFQSRQIIYIQVQYHPRLWTNKKGRHKTAIFRANELSGASETDRRRGKGSPKGLSGPDAQPGTSPGRAARAVSENHHLSTLWSRQSAKKSAHKRDTTEKGGGLGEGDPKGSCDDGGRGSGAGGVCGWHFSPLRAGRRKRKGGALFLVADGGVAVPSSRRRRLRRLFGRSAGDVSSSDVGGREEYMRGTAGDSRGQSGTNADILSPIQPCVSESPLPPLSCSMCR